MFIPSSGWRELRKPQSATQLTDQRNHLDLQINLLIEQENTKMLKSIAAKVGAGIEIDPELSALEESTRPEQLLDQIEKAIAKQ